MFQKTSQTMHEKQDILLMIPNGEQRRLSCSKKIMCIIKSC